MVIFQFSREKTSSVLDNEPTKYLGSWVRYPKKMSLSTCPLLSASLLVNFTFSKLTDNLWSPRIENGLSGCKYCLFGGGGSALPATNQEDRW